MVLTTNSLVSSLAFICKNATLTCHFHQTFTLYVPFEFIIKIFVLFSMCHLNYKILR